MRDELSFGSSAKLLAMGGCSMYYQSGKGFSCGGGGRIAIGVNLTEADRHAMIEAGAYPGRAKKHVFGREAFEALYPGVTINVQPGYGYGADTEKGWSDDPAYSGSFNFVDGRKFGLMLLVQ